MRRADRVEDADASPAPGSHGEWAPRLVRTAAAPVFLVVVVVAVYARTISYGLFFDDNLLVRPWTFHEVSSTFSGPFQGNADFAPYLRPLASASFATEWQVWHTHLWGYHLTNLALHLAAVLLLYVVLRKIGVAALAATFGATFFALLPSNAATVLWMAERTDAVAAIVILGAVLLLRRYEVRPRVATIIWMDVLLLVGLGFKEQASSLIPVVVVFMAYFGMQRADATGAPPEATGVASHWMREARLLVGAVTDRARLRQRLLLLGVLVGTLIVYLVYRQVVMPPGSLEGNVASLSPVRALGEGWWSTLKGVPWEVPSVRIAAVLAVVTVVTFVVSPRSTSWRLYLAGIGVIIAGVLPLTYNGGVEPRLLYVASLGAGMMVAALAATWAEWLSAHQFGAWPEAIAAGLGAALLAAAVLPLLVKAQDQFEPTSEKVLDQAYFVYSEPLQRARVDPAILRDLERRLVEAGRIEDPDPPG